ncbi:MAG: hypothetical protein JWP69_2173 [Flaviaesturariibacter sp.]|nr:hypothetical protein [Flaviaesturariibacter sp.]
MATARATIKNHYSPEELMREAIKEARKSIPEHADKTDPLVGAIIATADGEILARAHRGELREGEHCEFTLIERKLRQHNLKDCILYVTLEPCTDASRKSPKRGCCTHIARARLREVYVGVEDPNPKIATEGIKYLRNKGITVHLFPDHLEQVIRADNAQFIEEKEEEALQVKKGTPPPVKNLLEAGAPGANLSSFSQPTIQQFIHASRAPFTYPSEDFNQWAEQFQFIERTTAGNLTPTGLGLMLFGAAPQNQFPQTVYKVEIDYGSGEPEIRDFSGPLVNQLTEILDFVRDKALKLTINRSQGERTERADFPFEVLREAIANSIIHRDYTIEGGTNYLYISPDKIIVRSPGTTMLPLTIEDLRTFDTPSLSRNPKIMYIFNQMKLAEQRGIGLRNMRRLPESGFPQPVFEQKAGMLSVIFGRNRDFISTTTTTTASPKELSDDDKDSIIFLQGKTETSAAEFAKHFNISGKTAQRRLSKLADLGVVEITGDKRWTKYQLKK